MGGLNIRLRIWLGIGIFVFGYLLSTAVDYTYRVRSERELAVVAGTLAPAAQNGREAEAAFTSLIEQYASSFLLDDPTGMNRAVVEQVRVLKSLNAIAQAQALAQTRSDTARRLVADIQRLTDEAQIVYPQTPSGSTNIPPYLQAKIVRLGVETDRLRKALAAFDHDLSLDLDARLKQLRRQSAQVRFFALSLFAMTTIIATILVHITISRAILRPLSQVQSELAHERDLLRILLDHLPDPIYFKDADGKFIRINKALATRIGLDDPEQARGRTDADFVDQETAQWILASDRSALESNRPIIDQVQRITAAQETRWVAMTKVPVDYGSQRMIVGISRDITESQEAMEDLKKSETSFRQLFNAIPHAVFVCDLETLAIVEVNYAASQIYGYATDEFRAMHLIDVYLADERDRVRRAARNLDPTNLPRGARRHLTKSGRVLDVEIVVHMLEFCGRRTLLVMSQDLSERKQLEIELRHAQRLEAVGQLAAGIAHEINTPIQYVGDNLHFLLDSFKDQQSVLVQYERLFAAVAEGQVASGLINEVRAAQEEVDMNYLAQETPKAIEQSLDGIERVATIVRAMKAFAHPGSDQKMPADLNKALSDALIVARNEFKYVADVITDFGELPPVWCHLGDLNQVFLNLLVNAAHAIGDVVKGTGGRGEIRVVTRREGSDVIISISDTGCGIPAEIQSRVFDPFFTTKEVGKGSGQGLAIARNIVVEKHGGRITFEANHPRGTTFLVSLPIGDEPAAPIQPGQPVLERNTA